MMITPEQRQAWLEKTASSPFNRWLDRQVKKPNGTLDLGKLHAVARKYKIDKEAEYKHLNPGQQRMNIGVMLRLRVPKSEIENS